MNRTEATKPGLLIVDDDDLIVELLLEELSPDYDVVGASMRSAVPQALRQLGQPPRYALVDLGLPPHVNSPREGLALVRELVATVPQCAVIVISGQNEEDNAKVARTLGALDYIAKPCDAQQIRTTLARAAATHHARGRSDGLLGSSPAMVRIQNQIRQFAATPYPVLIQGASGTGKELIARALHQASGRTGDCVAINCAAVPAQLFEASLFGARRGSYTGATTDTIGLVAAAEGGTLFLDEIGDLSTELQPKLLRLLDSGEYYRVGEARPKHADVRIIAATNQPLRAAIATGAFREDLFHRLSVLVITTPALCDRGTDRDELLDNFRTAAATNAGTKPFVLDAAAQRLWHEYAFPGNVRELHNIVARLQVLHPDTTVTQAALAEQLLHDEQQPAAAEHNLKALLATDARNHAQAALQASGDPKRAAAQLGISERKLHDLLNELP